MILRIKGCCSLIHFAKLLAATHSKLSFIHPRDVRADLRPGCLFHRHHADDAVPQLQVDPDLAVLVPVEPAQVFLVSAWPCPAPPRRSRIEVSNAVNSVESNFLSPSLSNSCIIRATIWRDPAPQLDLQLYALDLDSRLFQLALADPVAFPVPVAEESHANRATDSSASERVIFFIVIFLVGKKFLGESRVFPRLHI